MRFHHAVLFVFVVGCNGLPPGGEGDRCASFPVQDCKDGFRCVNDFCTACGGVGQPCCSTTHGLICNAGAACDDGGDVADSCTADCGLIGLDCCPDFNCDEGSCKSGGKCEADLPAPDTCYNGSTPHPVTWVDYGCEAHVEAFMTDTDQQADDCRQQLINSLTSDNEICAFGQQPELTTVCNSVDGTRELWHCSDQQLATCEAYYCSDASCNWSTSCN